SRRAASAASDGTAKSELPANTRRDMSVGLQRAGVGIGFFLAALFLDPLADSLPLQVREVVHEQLALEVIDFVLDAYRQQPVDLELDRFAVQSQRAQADPLRAGHGLIESRDRQAALLHDLGPATLENL